MENQQYFFYKNQKRIVTLDEAKSLLPLIHRITLQAEDQLKKLIEGKNTGKHIIMNQVIDNWKNKIKKLGLIPSGVWLVDFDHGSGLYCWQFPEETIEHMHDYDGGFSNRVHIKD